MRLWFVVITIVITAFIVFFLIPSAGANRVNLLKNHVKNHEFLEIAPEFIKLPFSTLVRGEVTKDLMWKCRDGIEKTLNRLPEDISSKLEFLILNFEDGERGLADSDTIILRCNVEQAERLRVFLHEMGHVAYLGSSEKLQAEYRKLWLKSADGDFVSGYAKENEFEDFAESFLAFVEFGTTFRSSESPVLAEKYHFIEENFFPDRVYNGEREELGSIFDITKL